MELPISLTGTMIWGMRTLWLELQKDDGLIVSLKLDIGNWEIKKDKAKLVLNKYNFIEIKLDGI